MKLGIVIVTYNSRKDIARLLESIIIQKNKDLVVFIVDNNSDDETLEIVQKYQSELSLCIISCNTNNGFAKGNNIGIQRAMDEDCDLVFILNPDMQLEGKCIDILTKKIISDEKIGVIGPIVLFGNNPENIIQFYCANANFKTQKKVRAGDYEKLTNEIPAEMYCDFVLGGAMMIKCSVLKIIGLFEEDYFMYNDEIDIAYRVKKAGFQTICMRDSIVRHFHDFNKINKTGNNLMYYYVMRNRFLYFKKFHLYINLSFSLIIEIIIFPLKIIWSLRRMGNIKLLKFYYSGILDGLLGKKGLANKSFNENKEAKEILLTMDYELFLGKETGSVKDCMIEPTQKLASLLEKNGSRMTIFWDILHYYSLLKLEDIFLKLKQDRILIEEQILDLARRGHDIQLHLHPHWLDAKYENSEWNFNYERFKLHNLSSENKKEDVNTITGCISISKKLMEDIIRKVNPDYKVNTFRAGGYLIEPFNKLKDAFLKNEIKIDSSVCPGLYNPSMVSAYDFRFYPNKIKYNFDSTPKIITDNGKFIEIPIATIQLSIFRNILYKFVRRIKYHSLEKERPGAGIGANFENAITSNTKMLITRLFSPQSTQLTTDSNFREKFNHLYKKIPAYSTMILHSKLLNNHSIGILGDYVSTNKIRFISIQYYLTKNKE